MSSRQSCLQDTCFHFLYAILRECWTDLDVGVVSTLDFPIGISVSNLLVQGDKTWWTDISRHNGVKKMLSLNFKLLIVLNVTHSSKRYS